MFKKLSPQKNNKELLVQTLVSLIVRGVGALSGFILTIFITNKLGITDSGAYFIGFSIITILSGVGRLGLDNTVLRFSGIYYSEQNFGGLRNLMVKSLSLVFAISICLSILLFFFSNHLAHSFFHIEGGGEVLKLFSPALLLLSLITLLGVALQGMQKTILSVFTTNISTNLFLITIAFVAGFKYSSSNFASFYSLSCLFTLLIAAMFFASSMGGRGKVVNKISWSKLFNSCLPLWIVVIMNQTTQWGGQIISGAFVSPDQVSLLSTAQRTAMLTSIILMAVNMVVAPKFASLYKQKKYAELKQLSVISLRTMLLIVIPIISCLLIFPSAFMRLFGEGFEEGATLLQILVVGQFVNVLTGSVGYLLSMSGHERDLRNIVIFSGVVSLIMNFILIPLLGVLGSALATSITIITQNLLAAYWVRKRLDLNIFKIF